MTNSKADYSVAYLNQLLSQSRYAELDSYLFKAISADPNQLSHYLWGGMSKLKQECLHEAYQYALMACHLSHLSADAYALKAVVLDKLNQVSMARHALEKAIYLDPLNTSYLPQMKKLLIKEQQSDLYIEKSIYFPKHDSTFNNRELNSYNTTLPNEDKKISSTIDVLIPVYSNYKATKDCLESVLKSLTFNTSLKINILVVNDASPDPRVASFLLELQSQKKIELLINKHNMGFIKTVNRGLELHSDRDIVLLNADTYVKGDWLKRLHCATYSEGQIASVTPLSNNAELVSFPIPMRNNKLTNIDYDTELFDTVCKEVNKGDTVDIPTGVGFCMYIRRAALNKTGFLNTSELHRGYGEEVDLCFRFEAKGWKNKCATDVFVAHIGGCSFRQEKRVRVVQNLKILNIKYPLYEQKYDSFLKNDPLKKSRKNIEVALLKKNKNKDKYTLILSPVNGWKNIKMQDIRFSQAASTRNYIYLYFKNYKNGVEQNCLYLSEDKEMSYANLRYEWPNKEKELIRHLQYLNIDNIEIHELKCFDKTLLDIIIDLNAPYKIFVSDFSLICQRTMLVDSQDTVCKITQDKSTCQACINESRGHFMNTMTNQEYRRWSQQFYELAEIVYLDTEEIKTRINRQIKAPNFYVKSICFNSYLPDSFQNRKGGDKCFIFLILLSENSTEWSYKQLLNLVRYTTRYNPGISFLKTGHSAGGIALTNTSKVKVISNKVFENDKLEEFIVATGVNAIVDMNETPKANYYLIKKLLQYKLPISISENNLPRTWSHMDTLFPRKRGLNSSSLTSHLISICQ